MFSFFDDLISILFIGFVVGNTELDSNPKIVGVGTIGEYRVGGIDDINIYSDLYL